MYIVVPTVQKCENKLIYSGRGCEEYHTIQIKKQEVIKYLQHLTEPIGIQVTKLILLLQH